ncbi:hypothetical protein N7499_001212 [Penicillium canescens]|uniref:Uncharacterized protein n=1 Tax=Penicillium canescens TaxID=5083 RepID=A0AAD6I3V2_PENCN|nr:hypothetical protein N7460_012571 [Penicillium canescens]KAJ6041034.1 hypothetical protein N7444_009939 [Penicillium canescens]KAJ6101582.1 hypothetical protein N7499_001212 [Penicillium canescens]KAJ6174041.1 hypothetical protein N7485_006853 [Penicillium canescens]
MAPLPEIVLVHCAWHTPTNYTSYTTDLKKCTPHTSQAAMALDPQQRHSQKTSATSAVWFKV